MKISSRGSSFKRFTHAASAFGADVNGNFALMTGLMLLPLVGFSSLAIDHWKVSTTKSDIENAADAAVLGAINRAASIMRATGDKSKAVAEGKAAGKDQFDGNVGKIPDTQAPPVIINVNINGLEVTANVQWSAKVKTTLGSFYNWSSQNIKGNSRAAVTMAPYVQIHVVVDNSASMGIGATPEAQAQLFNDPSIKCAVACHLDGQGGHTPYSKSRYLGIKTRIDVVRDVLIEVAKSIVEKSTIPNQIKISVSTFSNEFAQMVKIGEAASVNMTSFKERVEQLGLASVGGGTDFHSTLKKKIPEMLDQGGLGGDGLTESRPIRYVFFITDGVEHTVQRKPGPAWEVDPDAINASGSPIFVNPHPQVNNLVSRYSYGGQTRNQDTGWVQPLNPIICGDVKQRAKLLTLEIEYLVPIEAYWKHDSEKDIRFGWIKDNILRAEGENTVSHNRFRACASTPEDASKASSKPEIEAAIQAMFEKVLPKPPRLLL